MLKVLERDDVPSVFRSRRTNPRESITFMIGDRQPQDHGGFSNPVRCAARKDGGNLQND
jgi:hypothetical protein